MKDRCLRDELLAPSVKGELIDTEIEIRSGRGETFADAAEQQRARRTRLFGIADEMGVALAATGTHPWANYLDQHIIDTEHYRRLERDLRWVAQRNNTWSLHVHVGIRCADRAVAVSDRMRELLPALVGVSANSPFLDHRETGLHSVRTEIFTRVFPRCGVHEPFGDWETYADFVRLLHETDSIVEATQLWWSVRPHHSFGTVEVRICDAQTRGDESFNLAALVTACVAQAAMDLDEGAAPEPLRHREIEENLWRAIRHGMDGEMIDFRERRVVPTRTVVERLMEWTEPARGSLGLEVEFPERNGAQRAYAALAEGAMIEEIYRHAVEETKRTYAPEEAVSGR
jgi:glutamate---cysteine ligase / carboxylate-amine ligase